MNLAILRDTVSDMVADLLFYDRKEDIELPKGAIEKAIKDETISIEYIVDMFRRELERKLKDNKWRKMNINKRKKNIVKR